jgi:putative flippase GtrA
MTSAWSVRQAATFGAVGAAATATHVVVALALHQYGGMSPLSANVGGYTAAVLISYFGNSVLTFRKPAANGRQFGRFVVVSLAALALNQLLVFLLTETLRLPFAIALVPVVVIVPIFTFVLSKLWAFVHAN